MAFFNNLLWEKYPVDFHKTFRVCLSCKGLLLCKFPKPTELFNTFKIEHESRDFRKSLNFYIADAGQKKTKKKRAASVCWQVSVSDYLNNCRLAKSINSFDFKQLYTNIPHDKVIEKVSDLIKRCFDEKKVKYTNVSANFKASWSDDSKLKWSLQYDDILELFRFLINNIYVKFRGNVYRQVVGIPMGCDCAPQVADLFLYWYEYNYITKGVDSKNHIIHFLKFLPKTDKSVASFDRGKSL